MFCAKISWIKIFLTLKMCLVAGAVFSQTEKAFTPHNFSSGIPPDVLTLLEARLERDQSLIIEKGRERNFIKALYQQRFEYLSESFKKGYFITDHPLTSVLNVINDRIHRSNAFLSGNVSVFVFASSNANAVSYGDGTICITLGLLERLRTEDEIAFVLCHELAHFYANHSGKNASRLAALNYDNRISAKIDAIMRQPYNRYTNLKTLFTSLDISINKHSRDYEFEADSIALQYFLAAGYNAYAPLRVMEVLKSADKEWYNEPLDFKNIFASRHVPLKDAWFEYRKNDLAYAPFPRHDADSLRTHPDCDRRFARLQKMLRVDALDSSQFKNGTLLAGLDQYASFEIINAHYHFKEFGRGLFRALQLAEHFPESAYPQAMAAKLLFQLYKEQKDHNLHNVLELPDPRLDESYDRFLTFINKLRLSEIASLGYNYAISRPVSFYKHEELVHALWLYSKLDIAKLDSDQLRTEYIELFPNGRYTKEMD